MTDENIKPYRPQEGGVCTPYASAPACAVSRLPAGTVPDSSSGRTRSRRCRLPAGLLQLANGAVYHTKETVVDDHVTEEREVVQIHDNKLEGFLELLEELGGKHALVFYNFQHDLDRIHRVPISS